MVLPHDRPLLFGKESESRPPPKIQNFRFRDRVAEKEWNGTRRGKKREKCLNAPLQKIGRKRSKRHENMYVMVSAFNGVLINGKINNAQVPKRPASKSMEDVDAWFYSNEVDIF